MMGACGFRVSMLKGSRIETAHYRFQGFGVSGFQACGSMMATGFTHCNGTLPVSGFRGFRVSGMWIDDGHWVHALQWHTTGNLSSLPCSRVAMHTTLFSSAHHSVMGKAALEKQGCLKVHPFPFHTHSPPRWACAARDTTAQNIPHSPAQPKTIPTAQHSPHSPAQPPRWARYRTHSSLR